MLLDLPSEILNVIYSYLTKSSLNQLCLTNHSLYQVTLPFLYRHVVFTFRNHIRQLESSLQRKTNVVLLNVIEACTTQVTLKSKQTGYHHLIIDALSLLRRFLPNLTSLIFADFHQLSVTTLAPVLSTLPHLDHLVFRYCNLVAQPSNVAQSFLRSPAVTATGMPLLQQGLMTTTKLELYWTNFTKPALDVLLERMPNLTTVALHANHNRCYRANDQSLTSLCHFCPKVANLTIGLQEVGEDTISQCITFFGPNLVRLNLRCHSPWSTLLAIAKHARHLQDLTIRFPSRAKWYSSALHQDLFVSSALPAAANRHLLQQQLQVRPDPPVEEQGGLLDILFSCQELKRLQVISVDEDQMAYVQRLPPVLCKAINTAAHQRIRILFPDYRRPDIPSLLSGEAPERQATQPVPSTVSTTLTSSLTSPLTSSSSTLSTRLAAAILKTPVIKESEMLLVAQSSQLVFNQPGQKASAPCLENSLVLDMLHLYHIRSLLTCFV